MGCMIITCYIVIIKVFVHLATPQECPSGTYLYLIRHTGQHFCIECPDGTFIQPNHHQQTSCRQCEKIQQPELEILILPCNKTQDAVIHCVDGYYRDEARNPRETGQCKKCTQCEFVGQPCNTYRDTVCCWDENFDVVPNHHGVPQCRERPWFCRQGQYFNTSSFQCLPCPDNTFMPLDHHIKQKCWDCRDDTFESHRPLHSVVIRPCNRTHAPVIRCEDGFFMNPNMGYRDDSIGCSPCTDCSTKTDVPYEGRKCDGKQDTVCCPRPNMTIVYTPEDRVCTAPSTDCYEGDCLYHYVRTNSTTCSPCIGNTDLGVTPTVPLDHRNVSSTTERGLSAAIGTQDPSKEITHNESFAVAIGSALGLLFVVVFSIIILLIVIFLKKSKKHNVGLPDDVKPLNRSVETSTI